MHGGRGTNPLQWPAAPSPSAAGVNSPCRVVSLHPASLSLPAPWHDPSGAGCPSLQPGLTCCSSASFSTAPLCQPLPLRVSRGPEPSREILWTSSSPLHSLWHLPLVRSAAECPGDESFVFQRGKQVHRTSERISLRSGRKGTEQTKCCICSPCPRRGHLLKPPFGRMNRKAPGRRGTRYSSGRRRGAKRWRWQFQCQSAFRLQPHSLTSPMQDASAAQ